jgi:hypothetical protein
VRSSNIKKGAPRKEQQLSQHFLQPRQRGRGARDVRMCVCVYVCK